VGRWGLVAVATLALVSLGAVFAGTRSGAPGGAGTSERDAASARAAAPALRIVAAIDGLDAPLYVTAAPGEPGRLYVVEQGGTIRIVENGRVRPQPFLDVRSLVLAGGEQGLLGLAFHPGFARNGRFYVNYTNRAGDTRVVEYRARAGRALPGSARVLLALDQPYGNHNGGMLAFGPDGRLWVGTGDGGSGGDPENHAQTMGSLLGKLLTIDVDRRGAQPAIVALGLRNPWRFAFDRANGDLYIGDVGQNAIEEVNYVRAATTGLLNFGWAVKEGRAQFDGRALGPGRLVDPIAQYTHASGCSITGGHVYRGRAVPAAAGRYFYGDYCSGIVWSLRVQNGRAVGVRREAFRVPSLASFGEDAAGELYLVSLRGTIYRLR
jgi:glucose/arabinose dehydrogenase